MSRAEALKAVTALLQKLHNQTVEEDASGPTVLWATFYHFLENVDGAIDTHAGRTHLSILLEELAKKAMEWRVILDQYPHE